MRRRKTIVVLAVLFIIAAIGIGTWRTFLIKKENSQKQESYQTAIVKKGNLKISVVGDGLLEGINYALIKSKIGGQRLTKVVEEGVKVRANQVIAQLDTRESDLQVKQAKANLENAQARLNQTRISSELQVLQMQNDLKIAESSLREAKINFELVKSELTRDKQLFQGNSLSEVDLKEIEAKYLIAQEKYEQAKEKLNFLQSANPIKEELLQADIKSAQAQVNQAQISVNQALLQSEDTSIRSPFSGVVTSVKAQVGDLIFSGHTIATVSDLTTIYMKCYIDEIDISPLKIGQIAKITVDSLPGETLKGKVTSIGQEAKVQQYTSNYEVLIELENTEEKLLPGMTGTAEIIIAQRKGVLLVPNTALAEIRGRKAVLVLIDGKPQLRRVKTGLTDGKYTEIISGLEEGEKVIIKTYSAPGSSSTQSSMLIPPKL